MPSITFEFYVNNPRTWTSIGSNTLVFSGASGITATIVAGAYQDACHLGSGDPGADQCTTNHVPNVKYISDSQMDTGGGTEAINDSNLDTTECTLRVHFQDATAYQIQNARLYAFDGATVTNPPVGVTVKAFERGVGGTAWTPIAAGGTYGGDNITQRLQLSAKPAAADHYWYVALSASPESAGEKTDFDFGVYMEYY